MDILWGSTIAGNVFLDLWLVHKGYSARYRFLCASCILSVFGDLAMLFCMVYDHSHYTVLRNFFHYLFLPINFMICVEGVRWRDWGEHVPVEIYAMAKFFALTAQRSGFLWSAYYMKCGLRWANLAMILWYVWWYRKEFPPYERRDSRPTA